MVQDKQMFERLFILGKLVQAYVFPQDERSILGAMLLFMQSESYLSPKSLLRVLIILQHFNVGTSTRGTGTFDCELMRALVMRFDCIGEREVSDIVNETSTISWIWSLSR